MNIRKLKRSAALTAATSLAASAAVVGVASSAAYGATEVDSHAEFLAAILDCESMDAGETCEIVVTDDFTITGDLDGVVYAGDADVTIKSLNGSVIDQGSRADNRRFLVFQPTTSGAHLWLDGLTLRGFGSTSVSAGGTIQIHDASLTVMNTVIDLSVSSSNGGAIAAENTPVSVIDSRFRSNDSDAHGGAIYTYGATSEVNVTSSLFDGNLATNNGAAIHTWHANATVVNSTFTNNVADALGGALSTFGGNQVVSYSTFHRNGASDGAHLFNDTGTQTTISASVIGEAIGLPSTCYGNTATFVSNGYNALFEADCEGAVHGTDLVLQDDLTFYNLADNGGDQPTLMPRHNNPVIDAIPVASCALSLDQRGSSRPQGNGCEIGAVEIGPSPFSDVPMTHPFAVHILWLADSGVTSGYEDGTFRPSAQVSRMAMAAFLYRFFGSPEFDAPETATFTDVPTTHPFFEEIEWLVAQEITTGYDDDTFRPSASVSRQAMAAFLYRSIGSPMFTIEGDGFTDVPESHPFYTAISWVVESEVATGYSDNTYRPGSPVTRQAMAAFLARLNDMPM